MNSIEEQIQKAQARGEFDNLSGSGKPFKNQDENPYNAELRLAHKALKEGGYTLPFIKDRQVISSDIESARKLLRRAAARNDGTPWAKLRIDKAKSDFAKKVEKINKKIQVYNLKAPNTHFHLLMLDVAKEIEAFFPSVK